MTCPQCESPVSDNATFCAACGAAIKGTPAYPAPAEATAGRAEVEKLARATLKALKAIVVNPVDDLPQVFAGLQKMEALKVGLVLAGLFDLCAIIGLYFALPHWAGSPGFGDILKLLLLGIVPPAAITGASALARKTFQGKSGSIESDVFLAGVSLAPVGLLLLLSGLLGLGNIDVVTLVGVFALTYTILILYVGCTQISQITTSRAVPAVPIVVLIAGWLSKIIFAAMF